MENPIGIPSNALLPEIAQGRLEALLNFQTLIAELTGLPMSNSSLLDEGTAAAEAMAICKAACRGKRNRFFISDRCHPQTIVVVTRAEPIGMDVVVGDASTADFSCQVFAASTAIPRHIRRGRRPDTRHRVCSARRTYSVVATDLLALTLLRPPGELGADMYRHRNVLFPWVLADRTPVFWQPEKPIGASCRAVLSVFPKIVTANSPIGSLCRRANSTSDETAPQLICTAQVLLAIMASMYAVYHGPKGLVRIASRVRGLARCLATGLKTLGYDVGDGAFFDTVRRAMMAFIKRAESGAISLYDDKNLTISLDETTDPRR